MKNFKEFNESKEKPISKPILITDDDEVIDNEKKKKKKPPVADIEVNNNFNPKYRVG